jgi:hypothetical protein
VEAATGAIAGIPQTTGLAAAGATEAPIEIPAGGSMTRGGVMFSCGAGETACMVSFTVDAMTGDVSGTWSGGEVMAEFVDPLEVMNDANAGTIAGIMGVDIDIDADAGPPVTPAGADMIGTTVGGLMNGTLGVSEGVAGAGAANDMMLSVTADFDPNTEDDDTTTPANEGNDTLNVANNDSEAGALGLEGWDSHRVLHADWGDTDMTTRDGGFETAVLVYSNIEMPAPVAFEDAAMTIASPTIRPWFTLVAAGLTNPGTVSIVTTSAAWAVPTENIVFTVEDALVADITQVKTENEQVRGTYFGAAGLFTCETEPCTITRPSAGDADFTVADSNDDTTDGSQGGGTWRFDPDDDETVTLPDQDWLAFGFWLTAPDDAADGTHRVGVFYHGMEEYAGNGQALTGNATYNGSAAGYYVNRGDSGVFTADATLTADFGEATTDAMLSGRIDNFRNAMGGFISSDTRADPNDPMQGGEGDWFVRLNSTELNEQGTLATDGEIGGSADGVQWAEGEWNAQAYGPGHRTAEVAAPTGVAGTFRAITDELSDETYKGVIGAFGAELGTHTPAATP